MKTRPPYPDEIISKRTDELGQKEGLYNAWYLYNDYTPGINNFNSNNRMIINIHP